MEQLTQEQAVAFAESGAWREMEPRARAAFQLAQDRLCMPFGEFHKAVEEALGRPVYTHEFGLNRDGLVAEMEGRVSTPSLSQVLALIPAEKLIVIGIAQ